jgi:hypothetical protein
MTTASGPSTGGRRARTVLAPLAPLLVVWAGGVVWMLVDDAHDPLDPSRTGTANYGHNGAGIFAHGVLAMSLELLVLALLLRPGARGGRLWLRALLVGLPLLPYTAFSFLLTMHGGGVLMIHALWVAVACLYVLATGVIAAIRG